jgi:hypothetical protein
MRSATVTQPREDLPAARRRLDYAISALLDDKPITVHRDDDTTQIVWLDPIYTQAVESIAGQTGERSGGRSTTPIWANLLDLVTKIDRQVAQWHPEWPIPDVGQDDPPPTTVARLRLIQARKWRVEDVPLVEAITAKIDAWVAEIQETLNPEPTIYLMAPSPSKGAAACPACGTDYVWKKDAGDNNRPVRQPALKVTSQGCHCQKCRTAWEPYSLKILAGALGYPLADGVLE